MTYHILFPGTAENNIRVSNIDLKSSNKYKKTKSAFADVVNLPPRQAAFRYGLYTAQKQSHLFIFQAPDAGGKDGLFILSVQ